MATIQELQRLINELESKIANLAPNNAGFVNLLNNLKQSASNSGQLQQNLDAARQLLGSVNKEIQEINDELGYTFKSFQAIVNELTKGKANIGNINKGVQSLTNIAQKLVNRQSEYGKLTATELKKQRDSAFITFENLRVEREILKDRLQNATLSAKQRTADTIRLRELNGILQANIGLENSLKRQLEYAYEEQQAIEDSLGITGNLLKAFATLPGLQSISKYLKIDDAVEEMENLSKRFIETVKKRPEIESQFTQLNSEMSRLVDGIARIDEVLETATDPAVIARFQANREQAAKKLNDLTAQRAKLERDVTEAGTNFVAKVGLGLQGLTTLAQGFGKALLDPAAIFEIIAKSASTVNSEVVGLQKSIGLSYGEAQSLRKEFAGVAISTGDTFYTTTKLVQAQLQFNEALGFTGKVNAENAKTFVDLTQRLGIAAEAAAKLQYFSEATGVDFEKQKLDSYETVSAVESQYGIHINQKQVMEEVGKASAYNLVQFKGSVTALSNSVAEAKALGTTLEQVNQVAAGLLNFESSIQSELEAELLTGRQINLEQARYYALTNDVSGLMGELNNEIGTFSDFSNMNRIQQEAFAKSLGMSVNDLSEMLLIEQYRGQTYEQIAAQSGREVADRVEALTVQERFNTAIEKLQGMVADLVAGPLGTMASLFASILGSTTGLFTIMGALVAGPLVKAFRFMKAMKGLSIAEAIATIVKSNAWMGPAGIAVSGAIIGGMIGLIAKYSGDDVMSAGKGKPGYGQRTLLAPEGAIALNDKDTVIAGTNLGGGQPTPTPEGRGTTNVTVNLDPLLAAMKELISAVRTETGKVFLDGEAVGKVMAMNNYQTGKTGR
jgi:hypothetical protein